MMSVFAIGSIISVLMYLLSFAALVLFVIAIVFYVKSDKAGNRKSLFIASVILYSLTLVIWIAGSVVVGAMTGKMMYASVTEADVVRLSVTSIIFNGLRALLNVASVVVSILSMVKSRKFAAAKAAPGVNPGFAPAGPVPPVYQNGQVSSQTPPAYQNGPTYGPVPPTDPNALYGQPPVYTDAVPYGDPAAPSAPDFPAGE